MSSPPEPDTITMRVVINGTDVNPWHRYNLRQNPFPQLAKSEYAKAEAKIASLDGDPITCPQDIRERLDGFSSEFITGIIERWQPGQRVRLTVSWPA